MQEKPTEMSRKCQESQLEVRVVDWHATPPKFKNAFTFDSQLPHSSAEASADIEKESECDWKVLF